MTDDAQARSAFRDKLADVMGYIRSEIDDLPNDTLAVDNLYWEFFLAGARWMQGEAVRVCNPPRWANWSTRAEHAAKTVQEEIRALLPDDAPPQPAAQPVLSVTATQDGKLKPGMRVFKDGVEMSPLDEVQNAEPPDRFGHER